MERHSSQLGNRGDMITMGYWREGAEPGCLPMYFNPDYASVPRDFGKPQAYYARPTDESAYNGMYPGYPNEGGRMYHMPVDAKGLPAAPGQHLIPYSAVDEKTGKYYEGYRIPSLGMFDGRKIYESIPVMDLQHGAAPPSARGGLHISRIPGQANLPMGSMISTGIGLSPAVSSAMSSVPGSLQRKGMVDFHQTSNFVSTIPNIPPYTQFITEPADQVKRGDQWKGSFNRVKEDSVAVKEEGGKSSVFSQPHIENESAGSNDSKTTGHSLEKKIASAKSESCMKSEDNKRAVSLVPKDGKAEVIDGREESKSIKSGKSLSLVGNVCPPLVEFKDRGSIVSTAGPRVPCRVPSPSKKLEIRTEVSSAQYRKTSSKFGLRCSKSTKKNPGAVNVSSSPLSPSDPSKGHPRHHPSKAGRTTSSPSKRNATQRTPASPSTLSKGGRNPKPAAPSKSPSTTWGTTLSSTNPLDNKRQPTTPDATRSPRKEPAPAIITTSQPISAANKQRKRTKKRGRQQTSVQETKSHKNLQDRNKNQPIKHVNIMTNQGIGDRFGTNGNSLPKEETLEPDIYQLAYIITSLKKRKCRPNENGIEINEKDVVATSSNLMCR